jgi:hypothetical protein
MVVQKGTVGVWNGTGVRLFKVEKGEMGGPSLRMPMGAVDAVGGRLVGALGGLSLRGGQPAKESTAINSLVAQTEG